MAEPLMHRVTVPLEVDMDDDDDDDDDSDAENGHLHEQDDIPMFSLFDSDDE